ncbi:MAG: DUF3592 domain-containing protein [Acidobacteriaceae bacterium]|jgi:hypothetical protein
MEFLRWLRKSFERVAPLLAGGLPVLGLGLLVVAAVFAAHSWNFARTRVRATATITENVSGFAKEGGVVYTPRFRFRLPSGELVTVKAAQGSEEIEFAAGEAVPVLYRAGDPQGAVIATVWRAYQRAIVFGVLGVVLFDLGWALRVMVQRRTSA